MEVVTVSIILATVGWFASAVVGKAVNETCKRVAKHFSKKNKTKSLIPRPQHLVGDPHSTESRLDKTNEHRKAVDRCHLPHKANTSEATGCRPALEKFGTQWLSGFVRRELGSYVSDTFRKITDRSKQLGQITERRDEDRSHALGRIQPTGVIPSLHTFRGGRTPKPTITEAERSSTISTRAETKGSLTLSATSTKAEVPSTVPQSLRNGRPSESITRAQIGESSIVSQSLRNGRPSESITRGQTGECHLYCHRVSEIGDQYLNQAKCRPESRLLCHRVSGILGSTKA